MIRTAFTAEIAERAEFPVNGRTAERAFFCAAFSACCVVNGSTTRIAPPTRAAARGGLA